MANVNKKQGEANDKAAEQVRIATRLSDLGIFLDEIDGGESLLKAGRTRIASVRCKTTGVQDGSVPRQMMLFLMTDCIILCSSDGRSSGTGGAKKKRNTLNFGFITQALKQKKAYTKEFVFSSLKDIAINKVAGSGLDFTLSLTNDAESIYQMIDADGGGDGSPRSSPVQESPYVIPLSFLPIRFFCSFLVASLAPLLFGEVPYIALSLSFWIDLLEYLRFYGS